jgi:hypothetical protein
MSSLFTLPRRFFAKTGSAFRFQRSLNRTQFQPYFKSPFSFIRGTNWKRFKWSNPLTLASTTFVLKSSLEEPQDEDPSGLDRTAPLSSSPSSSTGERRMPAQLDAGANNLVGLATLGVLIMNDNKRQTTKAKRISPSPLCTLGPLPRSSPSSASAPQDLSLPSLLSVAVLGRSPIQPLAGVTIPRSTQRTANASGLALAVAMSEEAWTAPEVSVPISKRVHGKRYSSTRTVFLPLGTSTSTPARSSFTSGQYSFLF